MLLVLSVLDVAGAVVVLRNGKYEKANQYVLCIGLIALFKAFSKFIA